MIKKAFICDLCKKETTLSNSYDYRTGVAGIPINNKEVCRECVDKILLDKKQTVTKKQINKIKKLADKCKKIDWVGRWSVNHTIKSWVFRETKMRTQNINKITKGESNNIISEMMKFIEKEKRKIKCEHKIEDWGFDGWHCIKCNETFI